MRFSVLGPVLVSGRPPAGAIERALLARLLLAGGAPVPADELIEAAWPPERRAGAGPSLRVRLARLRATLAPAGGEALTREPGGYRLAVAPGDLDAARLLSAAAEVAHLPAEAALTRCEAALALWRGEPYADLDAVEAATAEARRLQAARDVLRRRHALALLESGRADEAADELTDLVEDDPLAEDVVCDLMRARYRAGRQADALAAYRDLAGRLAELGLRPGPEARDTEARILRHADELSGPGADAPRRTNLGARVASVVGRERETGEALAALDRHRVVTLVGPGGVGKTTLAGEVARAALDRLPGGAWLVDLAPLRDPDLALPAVATALGLRRVARGAHPGHDALELLRMRLQGAATLLVLDGAEHLAPGLGKVVRDLAAAGRDVRILVTSRRSLGLPGEAVIAVAPLGVPEGAGDLADSAAGRLLLERAAAACPRWRAEGAEAEAAARICRQLDGLPLALELSASRLRALPATKIAERLDDGLAVLGRGTLDASIDASHALLSAAEQELFRRLSCFECAFDLEDAEAVGGGDEIPPDQVLELLVALAEHSMVQCEADGPRRYRLLEALRVYARERLDPPAAEANRRRHARRLATLAEAATSRLDPLGPEAAGEPLVPRQADLERAFAYAMQHRDADLALRLAGGLLALHHRLGTAAAGVELAERALTLDGGDPEARLEALVWHVPMLLCELRVADASAALAAAVALDAQGTRVEVLRVLRGQVAFFAGDLEGTEAALTGVVEPLLATGRPFTAGMAEWLLGAAMLARGEAVGAAARLEAACALFARCPDVCCLDSATAALVEATSAAGRPEDGAAACERALAFAPERPLGERNTHLLHEAAVLAARDGRLARARELADAAAVAAGRDPDLLGPWHAPAVAGDLAMETGNLALARRRHEEARALAADVRARTGPTLRASLCLMDSELRLMAVARAADDPELARAHALAALEHARESGAPAAIGAARAAVAELAVAVTA